MKKKEQVAAVLDRMDAEYGTDRIVYLQHGNAWQLLVAVILSAQCTDARVNLVTPALFARYDSLEKLAAAELPELEEYIRSTGFYHNKAKNLIGCAKKLVDDYGGEVPSDIDALTALPGVGRKTANVIRGNIYGEPSVVVDTHVKRIAKRLGWTKEEDPVKVEYDLMKVLPRDHWISANLHLIALGRSICSARKPDCENCYLRDLCPSKK